jgi:CxxC motif-containing protein (DUF1111 family)
VRRTRRAGLLVLALAGCDVAPSAHAAQAPLARAPVEVNDATGSAFSQPLPGLSEHERTRFFVGNSFFNQSWVSAPSSVQTRDGLGPLFNARSCSGCHFKDGRGRPPEPGQPMRSMLTRISLPGAGLDGAPLPDPRYGDQLQGDAIFGVPHEADVYVSYQELPGQLADGEPYSLRKPTLVLTGLGHGPLAAGLLSSARVAPAMIGLGLLEAVPPSTLRARVDADDRDHDGISGRDNRVRSERGLAFGRFGWKAEQASVREQTAAAFVGDLGLTSSLFPAENHSALQTACQGQASGGAPELSEQVLSSVVLYARTLAVPARRHRERAEVVQGERLFRRAGCAGCHVETLTTGADVEPRALAGQTIHPYTDLLLHDLGPGLSDQRPTFSASGSEWRTPPLWGIGLVQRVNGHSLFLHDGRARGLAEAVLWHGGEAERARAAFVQMDRADRAALLSFLASL